MVTTRERAKPQAAPPPPPEPDARRSGRARKAVNAYTPELDSRETDKNSNSNKNRSYTHTTNKVNKIFFMPSIKSKLCERVNWNIITHHGPNFL